MRRLALLLAFLPVPAVAGADGITDDLARHAGFLRSEEVGEIAPHSAGFDRAAAYCAAALARAGFSPLPGGGYAVPFPVVLAGSGPGTELAGEGLGEAAAGRDVRALPFSTAGAAEGSLLFAGYGLTGTDAVPDDYEGMDPSGRVVLLVHGAPPGAPRGRTPAAAAKAAADRGAAAVLLAPDPRSTTFDHVVFRDGRTAVGRIQDRGDEFLFVPRDGGPPRRIPASGIREILLAVPPGPPGPATASPAPKEPVPVPVLGVSAALADRLLGRSLPGLLDSMDAAGRAGSFARDDLRLRVVADVVRTTREIAHVAAYRRGSEPSVRSEAMLVSAPLGGPDEGGAVLALALADRLGRAPAGRRTVIIALRPVGGDGGFDPGALRRRLRVTPARARAELVLEARGRGEAILAPEGEGFQPLRLRAAEARLDTALVPGEAVGLLAPVLGKEASRVFLRSPRLPGPSEEGGTGAARDTVRLAAALVADRIDAPIPEKPEPKKEPEPKPAAPEPEPTLARARGARLAGDLELARKTIAGALDRHPGDAELYLERGRIRLAAKEYDRARSDADQIEKLESGDARAFHLRAEVDLAEDRRAEALENLEKAAKAGRAEAMLVRGLLLLDGEGPVGDREEALRNLSAAVAADPDGAVGATARGMAALARGDDEAAERRFTEAVGIDPELAEAWYWRGMLSVTGDRDPELGEADFDRALAAGADAGRTRFNRGLCRLGARKFTAAVRDFEACIEAGTLVDLSCYNVACAHGRMHNREEALRWLARAVLAGFDDADHAKRDPDLSILHGDPVFEKILEPGQTD